VLYELLPFPRPLNGLLQPLCKSSPIGTKAVAESFGVSNGKASIAARMRTESGMASLR